MKSTTQSFFGLLAPQGDVSGEIRHMVNCTTSGDRQYQILTQSNPVGLCASGINGDGTGNSMNSASRGDITVLADGEIYNLPELKKELNAKSYSSGNTLCDFIMSAYEAWGPGSFSKLNGIYAIALWDKTSSKLYLTRDSHGVKSLYFHFSENSGLTFSSRLRDIFRRKNISPDINIASVHEYLRFLDISAPSTIYKNIFALEPGCILEADKNGYSIRIMESAVQSIAPLTLEEALENLDCLLTKSIERRLDSGKTGFFLSGGIDSSILCALGSKIAPEGIEAFTVGFAEEKLNEMPTARKVAGFLGIKHHELYFNTEQYYNAFNDIVSSIDSPFADPAVIPTFLSFNYCKKHVDAVLDGTGADTLVGIMPARHIRLALKFPSQLPRYLRSGIASSMDLVPKLRHYKPIFDFDDPEELLIRWQGWKRREIEQLCGVPCSLRHTRFYKEFRKHRKHPPLELYSTLMGGLPDDRVHESALLSQLTIRFPFWDKEAKSFLSCLNPEFRYYKKTHKFILRELLNRYVPRSVWDKPKQGFNFPIEVLLKRNNFEVIRKYLSAGLLRENGFFNNEVVFSCADRYMRGDKSLRFKLWALIVFQAWYCSHRSI